MPRKADEMADQLIHHSSFFWRLLLHLVVRLFFWFPSSFFLCVHPPPLLVCVDEPFTIFRLFMALESFKIFVIEIRWNRMIGMLRRVADLGDGYLTK